MASKIRQGKNQVSLARALSKLGVASRSQSADLIREGKVSVDGRIVNKPDVWVDPKHEKITVDQRVIRKKALVYLAFNKPCGIVTTRKDELGRRTVFDFLPEENQCVFPVGRLDKETCGLLLFTNDTKFGERITNPKTKIAKVYDVVLNRPVQDADREMMNRTMVLKDGTSLKPARLGSAGRDPLRVQVTIEEGKNRQVRRMFEHFGYSVVWLQRLRIGSIDLGRLEEGKTRPLTVAEIKSIG